MFLQNVSNDLPDNTTSHLRRRPSSKGKLLSEWWIWDKLAENYLCRFQQRLCFSLARMNDNQNFLLQHWIHIFVPRINVMLRHSSFSHLIRVHMTATINQMKLMQYLVSCQTLTANVIIWWMPKGNIKLKTSPPTPLKPKKSHNEF
jgi:hypothetical protein